MSTDDDRMNEAKAWLNNQALTVGYYCLLTVSACDCPYCLHRAACIAHMPTATVSSPQNLVVFLSDRRPLAVTLTQCNSFTCVQYVHATSEDWQLSGLWSLWTQVWCDQSSLWSVPGEPVTQSSLWRVPGEPVTQSSLRPVAHTSLHTVCLLVSGACVSCLIYKLPLNAKWSSVLSTMLICFREGE